MNDGGPAFPVYSQPAPELSFQADSAGMSLRDYFAARALQAVAGAAAFNQVAEDMMKRAGINPARDTDKFIAMLAYDFADAMIAEREKRMKDDAS